MKWSQALCTSILVDGLRPMVVISGSILMATKLLLGSLEPRFCLRTQNLLNDRHSF